MRSGTQAGAWSRRPPHRPPGGRGAPGRLPPMAALFGAGAVLSLALSLICASVFWKATTEVEIGGGGGSNAGQSSTSSSALPPVRIGGAGGGGGAASSTPRHPPDGPRVVGGGAGDASDDANAGAAAAAKAASGGRGVNDQNPRCSPESLAAEYDRVNADRTPGLSHESLRRSRAWVGNDERLARVASALHSRDRPVTVIVCGGSISMGHGLDDAAKNRYSAHLESWMNEFYPVRRADNGSEAGGSEGRRREDDVVRPKTEGNKHEHKRGDGHGHHRVINMGVHGADMCAMAKRINFLLEDLDKEYGVPNPDMFLLEFGVNDYQGQDHLMHIDHKTDVFFDGFRGVALCAEVVVNRLLRLPNTKPAVAFLEFRTGILSRKTAQLLHVGVAMHYEIPVISYSEAVFPQYLRLVDMLNQSQSFSAPSSQHTDLDYPSSSGDPFTSSVLLPYPYGCSPCRADDISPPFRPMGCKSVCVLMERSGVKCTDEKKEPLPDGRQPCYVPIFAHDAVHPSRVGHTIARDIIVHALTSTVRDRGICGDDHDHRRSRGAVGPPQSQQRHEPHVLPTTGWLVGSPRSLLDRGDFVLVNDTMRMYTRWDRLVPATKTPGWSYYNDAKPPAADKPGWIATSEAGNESIRFDLDLPPLPTVDGSSGRGCYAVYLAVLRSYVGMGKFTVKVEDVRTGKVTSVDADGLWNAHISVWSDIRVTPDDAVDLASSPAACTGTCTVTVTTHPEVEGRGGNKVKVLTLSARPCSKGK